MKCAAVSLPAAAAAGPAADLAVAAKTQAAEARAADVASLPVDVASLPVDVASLPAAGLAAGAVAAGAAATPLDAVALFAASPRLSATRNEDLSFPPHEAVSEKATVCSRWRPGVSRTFQGSVLSPVLFVEEACSPTPVLVFQGPENKNHMLGEQLNPGATQNEP